MGDQLSLQLAPVTKRVYRPRGINVLQRLFKKHFQGFVDQYEATQRAFDLLVPKLKKYPQHQIRIEGNDVRIYWFDDRLGQSEERYVLGPLSLERAKTVRDVLVERGITPDRLSLAALGGTDPIVPFCDLVNRWKDRRVEFILVM